MVIPETICIQTTKTDSIGCVIYLRTCNNNSQRKRGHKFDMVTWKRLEDDKMSIIF